MSQANPMMCPDCGVAMNHHADKMDYTAAWAEPAAIDPNFGSVIAETHTCPNCGKTEMRRGAVEP